MIKPVLKGAIGVIRLIASDLDGTLLEKDGTLPAGIFDMVERLTRMGITFAAASGRQYSNLVRLFGPVAHQMAFVCENGAYNVIDGQEAGLIGMSPEDVRECIADLEERKMNLLVSGKQCCYMLDQNRKFTDDIVYRLRNTVTIVRSWNRGALFAGEKMIEYGTGPIEVEIIHANIAIKTNVPRLRVWSVNSDGYYVGQLDTTYEDGWLKFHVGPNYPGMYYLIMQE